MVVTFPELLGRDQVPIGTFVKIPSVETLEILKVAGFDFVVIDSEHAPLSLRDLDTLIAIGRNIGLPPLVRVADHGYGDVQRLLDAGAAGIFVPHVSTAAVAGTVLRQMLHPPKGVRGHGGGMRAGEWGMTAEGREAYVRDADIARILMIEEAEAIANLDEILAVTGLGGIFIGPGDLSMSMGVRPDDPRLAEAIDSAFTRAKAAGIPVGGISGDPAQLAKMIDRGYDFVIGSNDLGLLGKAAKSLIDAARA